MARIKARLQPAPWERIERYMSWRVPEETCNYLIRRGGADIVDAVIAKTGVDGLIGGDRDRPAGEGALSGPGFL